MGALSQHIKLYDSVSNTLNNIYNAFTPAIRQFETMHEAANRNINVASMDSVADSINAVHEAASNQIDLSSFDNVANHINNTTEAANILQERLNFEVFGDLSGINRFNSEAAAGAKMLQAIQDTQRAIKEQAANMELIPKGSKDVIKSVNNQIKTIRHKIESFGLMDLSVLDDTNIARVNSEYEKIRANMSRVFEKQEQINTAIASGDFSNLHAGLMQTERQIRDNIEHQERFTQELDTGTNAVAGLRKALIAVAGAISFKAINNFIQTGINLAEKRIQQEKQLAVVMGNHGALYEDFAAIRQRAFDIQNNTTFSADAMMGAATELTRHFSDTNAVKMMMDSLTDLAAGAGKAFSATGADMAGMSQYFVQAMHGNYRRLEMRLGMFLNDAQKYLLQHGDDMQRAMVMQDLVAASYGGMTDMMAGTSQGIRDSVLTAINEMKTAFGKELLPAITRIFEVIQSHLPRVEQMFTGTISVIQFMANTVGTAADVGFRAFEVIYNNWSKIAPVVWGIAGAVTAYGAALLALTLKKAAASVALTTYSAFLAIKTAAMTAAAGATGVATIAVRLFSAALKANPIGLVISLVGMLIAAVVVLAQRAGGLPALWCSVWTSMQNIVDGAISVMARKIEHFINSIVGGINLLLGQINRISGIDIGPIGVVTFGTERTLRSDARIEQRLLDQRERQANRLFENNHYYENPYSSLAHLFDGIGHMPSMADTGIADNVAAIAGNTGAIADTGKENLRYWRDLAKRKSINRAMTAEVKIDFGGITNIVNNNADIDGIVRRLEERIAEKVCTELERSYANLGMI